MVQESSLLKLENGQQKTVPLASHKENGPKFLKAIEIYTTKPQVVDRRVLCSVVVSIMLKPRTESFHKNAWLENYLTDFIGKEMRDFHEDVEKRRDRRDVGTERTKEAAMESNEKPGNNVIIRLCKILPRQSERMESFHQLVLIDETACEVFFIRLNKAKPYFPEDINQSWSYSVSCNVQSQQILITTSELYEKQHPVSALPVLTPPSKEWLFSNLATKLVKWTNEIDPELVLQVKKSVISMERYSQVHANIKTKYATNIIKIWPECTDPQKFVYEDISIAAYLIVLWEEERQRKDLLKKQSFVDLGCGNGLLVHILNSEGHPGKGIDLRKRKIWDLYGSGTNLEEAAINPNDTKHLEEYDWLIGNHSDELTPWIPVMAFRSSLNTRYFVLPCCFYDFNRKYIKDDSSTPQYRSYLNFIQEVGKMCGYQVEEDSLRIPSTKKICQIGMELPPPELRTLKNSQIDWYIETRCTSKEGQKSCNATGSLEDYLADLDKPMSEKAVSSKLPANFEPRQREETVRNCSNLKKDLKEKIVRQVFDAILTAGEDPEVQGPEPKKPRNEMETWRKGGVITIKDAVALFEKDTLKQLKSECGGLKTLLKNHYQIFHVEGNRVHMRDWSEKDSRSPKVSSKNKPKDSERREEKYKTKLCWFHDNHPDGCRLPSSECPFAHSAGDFKTLPSNETTLPNSEILLGKKLEKFDHAQEQLLVA